MNLNDSYEGLLFTYLGLLKDIKAVDDYQMQSKVNEKILKVCSVIEKQLEIPKETNENDVNVNVTVNHLCKKMGWVPTELADIISKSLMDKAKLLGKI